jgi:hypothetical protein
VQFPLLGGRLTVGLRTLNPPIGVRIPASQPNAINKLRAVRALFAHAQVSVEPSARMLDDLAAFQQTLFSSPGVELLADASLSGSTEFPDPDPELNEVEQQGKVVFNRACAQCHGGTLHPTGSTPETIVRPRARYHNIQTACPRPATDGYLPCPERLARNNSAATLEEMLDHYDAFFARLARLNPPPNLPPFLSSNGLVVNRGFVTADERAALLAYLRKL